MTKKKKITHQKEEKIGKKLKVKKALKMELEEILGSQLIKKGNGRYEEYKSKRNGGYGEYKSKRRSIIRKNGKK